MSKPQELSSADLSSLSRQLALVVDSDLSLQEGVNLIREQTKLRAARQMLQRVQSRVIEGFTLSGAFAEERGLLPDFYIQMLSMGEQSGNLARVLTRQK